MSKEKEPQPTLTINGKEFFESDLDENQTRHLTMLKALQPEIESLDLQLGTRLDHKDRLIAALESSLSIGNDEIEEATIIDTSKTTKQ
jgi:hypothetical protein